MKELIRNNLENPRELEKLYRENKQDFRKAFSSLYPELGQVPVADYWYERLHYPSEDISWGSGRELVVVLVIALGAGLAAKFPAIFDLSEEYFYPRHIGFIVFPFLAAYFAWKNKLPLQQVLLLGLATSLALVFINLLPDTKNSDTLLLSCIHLLLFLWFVLGVAYAGKEWRKPEARLSYLRYNGDLLVMAALLTIAGVMLTGITIGLFSLIGLQIENFYFEYVVIFGLAAIPIIGTYLTQTNPQLVNKVSPVIAKLFSPLVLVTLVVYLVAILYSGKDPYNDREFLLLFNALLIGVMAIILFSVAETSRVTASQATTIVLLLLAALTVVVNGIALSAILFRITEWGVTPNRIAVLGGNLLILLNLLLVTGKLFRVACKKAPISDVGNSIANFLPLYTLWIIIVTFLFPLLFKFA
ncbi:hypothetical protein FVR03_00875 [Pontibacter qinzhouensis]|uniref:DUF4153 domain-containing protein n=1 Tax=Pontibacter qinzhouensis TaxID=2603253 RepID=A0A5C8KE23_9BACT|nr:hypothetical protein [Pontibacter qinzhouensis]TXK52642.1 hypothetical protein FVR03_00875 [Pontibacter qinzhouensis]